MIERQGNVCQYSSEATNKADRGRGEPWTCTTDSPRQSLASTPRWALQESMGWLSTLTSPQQVRGEQAKGRESQSVAKHLSPTAGIEKIQLSAGKCCPPLTYLPPAYYLSFNKFPAHTEEHSHIKGPCFVFT